MKLGFIGFGEASSNIAEGLLSESATLQVGAYDVNIERATSCINTSPHSNRIHIFTSLESIIRDCDVFFCAVPGQYDSSLFEGITNLKIENKLFMDISTAKPDLKKAISEIIANKAAFYVDVAVLGSVPAKKNKVPMMLSGFGSSRMVEQFADYDMDMQIVGEEAGKASLVKLCRSIYMKGLAALSIELTEVAEYYGVKDLVYDSLSKSMDNDTFNVYTPRLIKGTIKHIVRRSVEIEECLEIIANSPCQNYMTEATLNTYKKINNKE